MPQFGATQMISPNQSFSWPGTRTPSLASSSQVGSLNQSIHEDGMHGPPSGIPGGFVDFNDVDGIGTYASTEVEWPGSEMKDLVKEYLHEY